MCGVEVKRTGKIATPRATERPIRAEDLRHHSSVLRLTSRLRASNEAFARTDFYAVTRNHAGTIRMNVAGSLGRQ